MDADRFEVGVDVGSADSEHSPDFEGGRLPAVDEPVQRHSPDSEFGGCVVGVEPFGRSVVDFGHVMVVG